MIIPIRCFTCGEITGDKWRLFTNIVNENKKESNKIVNRNNNTLDIEYIDTTNKNINKSIEGNISPQQFKNSLFPALVMPYISKVFFFLSLQIIWVFQVLLQHS